MRATDFVSAMYQCGVQSLPIISLTSMLFGLILAFVGAVQLTQLRSADLCGRTCRHWYATRYGRRDGRVVMSDA